MLALVRLGFRDSCFLLCPFRRGPAHSRYSSNHSINKLLLVSVSCVGLCLERKVARH